MVRIASVCRMRHCVSTVDVPSTAVEYAVSASEFMTIMTKSAVIPSAMRKSVVTKSAVAVGVRMADESRTVEGRSAGISWVSTTISTTAPATSVIAALRRDDANQERQSC